MRRLVREALALAAVVAWGASFGCALYATDTTGTTVDPAAMEVAVALALAGFIATLGVLFAWETQR
jgi:hypothetical protein